MMKNLFHKIFKLFGISARSYNVKYEENRNLFLQYSKLNMKFHNFTMIPLYSYIDNLKLSKKTEAIDGDIVECGVWRGGMIASIGSILGNKKKYWLFDSFEGLPEPKNNDGNEAFTWQKNVDSPLYYNNCSAKEEYAIKALSMANINNYEIVKGWFNNTLPENKVKKISLLRLDGDWYESTMDCLKYLYPLVVDNGIIIIDDYYFWDGCSKAVHDYMSQNNLKDKIYMTEHGVAYIIKNRLYSENHISSIIDNK